VLTGPAQHGDHGAAQAMLIAPAATYREIYDAFEWDIPARFNMAVACCDRWAVDPGRVALIHEQPDGAVRRYTFADCRRCPIGAPICLPALALSGTTAC
jgi:hypothetical protein